MEDTGVQAERVIPYKNVLFCSFSRLRQSRHPFGTHTAVSLAVAALFTPAAPLNCAIRHASAGGLL